MKMKNGLGKFFRNRNLVSVIDVMAQRYGLTPYEVLNKMTIDEFTLNTTVMICGIEEEKKAKEKASKEVSKGSNRRIGLNKKGVPRGFSRKVVKKPKGETIKMR